MTSDVQKNIEFSLKLSGVDPKSLNPLLEGFKNLDNIIKGTQKSIDSFQTTIKNLKTPASFATFAKNFNKINEIKLKDLGPLTTNLQKLSKIQGLPNIGAFVNNVIKLSSVSFASLSTLSKNLKAVATVDVSATVAKIRSLDTALRALEKQGGLTSFARFATDIRSMRSALDNAKASVNQMADATRHIAITTDNARQKMRGFADKIRTVVDFRLISEGIIALKTALSEGVTAIIEYDQSLKDLQAITGATSIEVNQMGDKILEVASRTKFSASEVAAGMRTLGQAGFTATESIQTMQGVADLATGTLSDMSQTVDLVTTAMRVFHIDASRSTEVVDTFANAVNRSKLTVEKLRTSMNYVGPIAQSANITFQELSAAMMVLANSGIRASTIGTSLRQVFSQLVSPSEKFEKAASKAGVSMADLDPLSKSLSTVLANLNLVLKDTGTAFEIFGKRGASAALSLTNTENDYNGMLSTVSRTGTAAEQASIQMEGLGVSFKNLRDKLGNLAISFGKGGISYALKLFVDAARNTVDAVDALANTIGGRLIIALTTVTTAVIGLTAGLAGLRILLLNSVFVKFSSYMFSAATALKSAALAGSLLQAALNPIVWIITTLSVIGVSLFYKLKKGAEEAAESSIALAGKYDTLEKRVKDYRIETANLAKGSIELKNASLRLRQELIEVARSEDDVADAALSAANSINPLSGEFEDGKDKLYEFQDQLNKFKTDTLVQAINQATTALFEEAESIDTWWTTFRGRYMQITNGIIGLPRLLGSQIWNQLVTNNPEEAKKAAENYAKMWNTWGNGVEVARKVSKAINEQKITWVEFSKILQDWQTSGEVLVDPQLKLIEYGKKINEIANDYISKLIETNKIGLDDESLIAAAKEAGFLNFELQIVLEKIRALREESPKTFANIIEKWKIDDFNLSSFTDAFLLDGGTIKKNNQEIIQEIESEIEDLIKEYDLLEEKKREAILTNNNDFSFWENYEREKTKLLEKGEKIRLKLTQNAELQKLRQYIQATEKFKQAEKKALEESSKGTEVNQRLLASRMEKIWKDYQKNIKEILNPEISDAEALQNYKIELKTRKNLLEEHLLSLERMENISDENKAKRREEIELAYYQDAVRIAENYRDQINPMQDKDEYEKRNIAVLEAMQRFNKQRIKLETTTLEISKNLQKERITNLMQLNESIYNSALSKQANALKLFEKELEASYKNNEITIKEYYEKQRDLQNKNFDLERDALLDQKEKKVQNLKKLEDLTTSLSEKEKIRYQILIYLQEVETQLHALELKRKGTLSDLTVEEQEALDSNKLRITSLLNDIKANKDKAIALNQRLTYEQEFALELQGIRRRHIEELEKLQEKLKGQEDSELKLKQARADQEMEIEKRKAAHEREMYRLRLEQNAQFAGDMATITKGLMDAGIVESKRFFEIYKAFATAEATISAFSAASTAYSKAMKSGNPVFAYIAYAAALAKGLTAVAAISAQQPSFAEGGLIPGSSPHKKADNVKINATAGEYMQPVDTVKAYGVDVMEALRKRLIPPDLLKSWVSNKFSSFPKIPSSSLNFAEGGLIPNVVETSVPPAISINMVNQSSNNLQMKQETPRFDGEKWVIGIILNELDKKGSFSKNLQSALSR